MGKQGDIREGIRRIALFCKGEPDVCAGEVMMYLHKMGVVIRVDKELPFPSEKIMGRLVHPVDLMSPAHGSVIEAYRLAQQDMGEAGFVAVEPLIERVE